MERTKKETRVFPQNIHSYERLQGEMCNGVTILVGSYKSRTRRPKYVKEPLGN